MFPFTMSPFTMSDVTVYDVTVFPPFFIYWMAWLDSSNFNLKLSSYCTFMYQNITLLLKL